MKGIALFGALCLFNASAALIGQSGHMGHPIDKNIIFPDLVVGGGVSTQIILMNPQPGLNVTGTLFFFNQDGTPLQVVNNGQTVNQLPVTLAPSGIQFLDVTGVNPTAQIPTVGWALLEVSGPAQGQDDPQTRVLAAF